MAIDQVKQLNNILAAVQQQLSDRVQSRRTQHTSNTSKPASTSNTAPHSPADSIEAARGDASASLLSDQMVLRTVVEATLVDALGSAITLDAAFDGFVSDICQQLRDQPRARTWLAALCERYAPR